MKKTCFCLSVLFGALSLICGICYGAICVSHVIQKVQHTKETATRSIKEFVNTRF
jgi:hypothetical protein